MKTQEIRAADALAVRALVGTVYTTQPRAGLWDSRRDQAFVLTEVHENNGALFLTFRYRWWPWAGQPFRTCTAECTEMLVPQALKICRATIDGETFEGNVSAAIIAGLQLRLEHPLPLVQAAVEEGDRIVRWVLS